MTKFLLENFIKLVILERRDNPIRQFYGDNFQHTIDQYTGLNEEGLPDYGVSYSDIAKWGINPEARWFPRGVYFYYLTPKCALNYQPGFAQDRAFANIARINYDRMLVLKKGGPRNFNEEDLAPAVAKLTTKYGKFQPTSVNSDITDLVDYSPHFSTLLKYVFTLIESKRGSFNQILHDAGYDGIVDIDQKYLPIENCQGVQTWPGGATLIQSIPNKPIKHTDPDYRLNNTIKRLQKMTPGTLKLAPDDIRKIFVSKQLPGQWHNSDRTESFKDIRTALIRALDFNFDGTWKDWAEDTLDKYGVGDYIMDLEANPTTPKTLWPQLLHHRDETVRFTAEDMVKSSA